MPDGLNRLYAAYVDTYRNPDGSLPKMMQLKLFHTECVVKNAELIADGEGFDAVTREAALASALLHDTGRYEQLKRYNTFRDADSVDHAVFSHDIVREKGWLEKVEGEGRGREWRGAVLKAILYHNRRDLPEGMDDLTAACAKTVRDADKLDIFRVLEQQARETDWRKDARAFWNLKPDGAPNPTLVRAIEEGRSTDYADIRSLSDFVLTEVGWMVNGLYFETSRRLCRERRYGAFCREFLHQITDDPCVDRICDLV